MSPSSRLLLAVAVVTPALLQAQEVTLLGYRAVHPSGWQPRPPASAMRLAEWTTPAAGGAAGAEVIAYFFGPGQGGNAESNLARWRSQFSNPDGSAVREEVVRDTSGAFPVTIASYRGTYRRGVGAGSSAEEARPAHALVAAVVETPRGTMFIQLFGPIPSVEAQRDAFGRFVRRLR